MIGTGEAMVLKSLFTQVAAIAAREEQQEKTAFWKRHNTLCGERPAIFISPDNAWLELLPQTMLECTTPWVREVEYRLRQSLIRARYLPDDVPIMPVFKFEKVIHNSWWGVAPKREYCGDGRSAWHHVPIIHGYDDWGQLRMPVIEYDEESTRQRLAVLEEISAGIMPVEPVGVTDMGFHLIHYYCDYRGLENLYLDLFDAPEMVHEVMRFFTDGILSMLRQLEEQRLLSLNNNEAFHYTGGIGFNDAELPAPGFSPEHVRLRDLWGAAEAQEFCNVSPEMHEEFALQYEREILEQFGLNGYGCCDDLGKKLDYVLKIKNLRRVAICPWADIDDFLPVLGDRYLMTWKPQPAHLSYEQFHPEAVREELRQGIRKARGGRLELILRDTNSCRNDPERFVQWCRIARETIAEEWR